MVFWVVCRWPPLHLFSGCRTQLHLSSLPCPGAITCVLPWGNCIGCQWSTESSSSWHWWCSRSTHISAQTTWPILYTPTATMIQHAIGSARRPAPTTLFHVRGRNLATELSLWPGQSCDELPLAVRHTDSLHSFKRRLKSYFFSLCFNDWQCNALQVRFRVCSRDVRTADASTCGRRSAVIVGSADWLFRGRCGRGLTRITRSQREFYGRHSWSLCCVAGFEAASV